MKYLVDTCVLSEISKPRPETSVLRFFSHTRGDRLAISVITLGELARGLNQLRHGKRREALALWLEVLERDFGDRELPVTSTVAHEWGRLACSAAKGVALPAADGLIAATASAAGLQVVTRNVRHFAHLGLQILDPWSQE